MNIVSADGIRTRYEVTGSGPPLLMFSPGGFDGRLENWTDLGRYQHLNLVTALSENFTCITFDKREAGHSGGRLQRLTWQHYAAQARGLLDALAVEHVHAMGGCAGCSSALALAVAAPQRVDRLVLFSPAGGPRYRMAQHARLRAHLAFAQAAGLPGVAELARTTSASFSKDARVGPWAAPLRTDSNFAKDYAATDIRKYEMIITGTARCLFDRDTVPGAEPEDLMTLGTPALIVPGEDESHAPSAARYLQECLPASEYWDVPVAQQTAGTAPARILEFLGART